MRESYRDKQNRRARLAREHEAKNDDRRQGQRRQKKQKKE